MASDMLSKVLEAEQKDKRLQLEASEKAGKLLAEAKAEAERLIEQTKADARREGDSIVNAAKLQAQENEKSILREMQVQTEAACAVSDEKRSAAVKAAVDIIIS